MATEIHKEIEGIIQVLNQTRELAKTEIEESSKDIPATESLMKTIISFIDEVKNETSSVPPGKVIEVYETAIRKMDDWARTELERAMLRPRLLEEREKTIASIVNFLKERSTKYSVSTQTGAQDLFNDYPDDD
jgi:hypothetical protein